MTTINNYITNVKYILVSITYILKSCRGSNGEEPCGTANWAQWLENTLQDRVQLSFCPWSRCGNWVSSTILIHNSMNWTEENPVTWLTLTQSGHQIGALPTIRSMETGSYCAARCWLPIVHLGTHTLGYLKSRPQWPRRGTA